MRVHKHHKWTDIEKVTTTNLKSELQFCKCGRVKVWYFESKFIYIYESMAHILDKDPVFIYRREFTRSDKKVYNFYRYGDTDFENPRVRITLNMKVMEVKPIMSYSDLIELAGHPRETRGVSVTYHTQYYKNGVRPGIVHYGEEIEVYSDMNFGVYITGNA